jgi:Ca2+-binding RTX toxin-like protein
VAFDAGGTLVGTSSADLMVGGSGIDNLKAGAGNDVLRGDEGADTLQGQLGDDLMIGGHGTDTLIGSYGDDTYKYNLGDGYDKIYDYGYVVVTDQAVIATAEAGGVHANGIINTWTEINGEVFDWQAGANRLLQFADTGSDTLSFGAGITFDDLTFTWLNEHMNIDVGDPANGDHIFISRQAYDQSAIETLQFDDGSTFDLTLL